MTDMIVYTKDEYDRASVKEKIKYWGWRRRMRVQDVKEVRRVASIKYRHTLKYISWRKNHDSLPEVKERARLYRRKYNARLRKQKMEGIKNVKSGLLSEKQEKDLAKAKEEKVGD